MTVTLQTTNISLPQMISLSVAESLQAISQLHQPRGVAFMENAAQALAACFTSGGKVLIAGNGGSLCDAVHFAEEFTGVFRKVRPPLPVIPLSDPGHITCTANDLGFESVFARGIQAYGRPGDIFIGLTTSGNSPNMLRAFSTAKEQRLLTISLLGKGGGHLAGVADLELLISGKTSDRVQEAHMTALHIIIELVESLLFPDIANA